MSPVNTALLLIGPTFMAKQAFNANIDKRIENMWRVHRNRVDKGMGGTYHPSGFHESMDQDKNMVVPNAFLRVEQLYEGNIIEPYLSNPFLRWHKSFGNYPSFFSDMDDYPMHKTDDFERMKKLRPKKGSTVGISQMIPREDTDEKLEYYDIQGESVYSNPPNPNWPVIDHSLDEEFIWAFPKNLYNEKIVKNAWMNPNNTQYLKSTAPFWGEKMSTPAFYKREKMPKFMRHWSHRAGLEALKITQAMKYGRTPDQKQIRTMESQVSNYITACYDHEKSLQLDDIYVTDNKLVDPKLITNTEEEDMDFYEY